MQDENELLRDENQKLWDCVKAQDQYWDSGIDRHKAIMNLMRTRRALRPYERHDDDDGT